MKDTNLPNSDEDLTNGEFVFFVVFVCIARIYIGIMYLFNN